MKDPYKLMVVDDSSLIRKAICNLFVDCENIEVIGEATNGSEALAMLPELDPDVVTLDINMPVMDGLTALKHIMIKSPRPTVMCSTLTRDGAETTFDALKYGAIDFIHKPSRLKDIELEVQHREIIKKVTLAASVDMGHVQFLRRPSRYNLPPLSNGRKYNYIIGIGTSEGGYSSLLHIIPQLDPQLPVVFVAVMHSDPEHMDAFINYLDRNSMIAVKRATHGEEVRAGICYIASGTDYVTINSIDGGYSLNVSPSPFPERRGAINMLMFSLADHVGKNSVGVILSGEGNDGGEGVAEIYNSGGSTIVQAPGSCLCREMARAAIEKCNSHLVVSGRAIATKINSKFSN